MTGRRRPTAALLRAALALALALGVAPRPAAAEEVTPLSAAPTPVGCAGAVCAEPAAPADVVVRGAEELRGALEAARGGEAIALAPGDYGRLFLRGREFDPPVTLRSADPSRPAVLTGLDLRGVAGLGMEGLVFEHRQPSGVAPKKLLLFRISGGRDIEIARSTFRGEHASGTGNPYDDGFAAGHGLFARGTRDLAVRGSHFTTLFRAAAFDGIDGLTFEGNRIREMRSEGLNLVAVRDAVIEGNEIGDFRASLGSPDHRDMIQFWTTYSTRPSERVTIRGNLLHAGQGLWTQSIFMRNEEVDRGRAGREMFYRDLLVEDNVIVNGHLHGITLGPSLGLVIRRNTLLRLPSATPEGGSRGLGTPSIRVAGRSEDVAVLRNVTGGIHGYDGAAAQPSWRVEGNVLVQGFEPREPGWWGGMLLAPPYDPRYRPDGPLGRGGVGAPMLELGEAEEGGPPVPVIRAAADPVVRNRFDLDAGLSRGAGEGARYEWRFSDGGAAEGPRVSRALPPGKVEEVTLVVTTSDGRAAEARTRIEVPAPAALRLDPERGAFLGAGEPVALPGGPGPVRLGPDRPSPSLPLPGVGGAGEARIALRLRAEPAVGAEGEVLSLGRGGMRLSMDALGALRLRMRAEGEKADLRTAPLRLHDGAWHEVEIALEPGAAAGAPGRLVVSVDGRPRAEGRAPGPMPSGELRLGHPEPERGFRGEIDRLEIRAGTVEEPA